MGITIKTLGGRELYVSEHSSVKAAVTEAVERGAYLQGADLRGAYLRGADLRGAYLQGADLRGADLQGADLQDADLQGAYLRGAYLRGADLRGAYLQGAYLRGAYLRGADLRGAYLQDADLQDAENADHAIAQTRILPDGDLIGWKKAQQGRIVKLRIPADAKRSHAAGRKCRAERAEVLAIYDMSGTEVQQANSLYDSRFQYEVGATVAPTEPFNEDMWQECAPGIHFYITRPEAEAHV